MNIFQNSCYLLVFACCFVCMISCTNQHKHAEDTQLQKDTTYLHDKSNLFKTLDQSPLDISYFPADFPLTHQQETDRILPIARIIYSRPQKKGRLIFGDSEKALVPYGKPWRLGANEATEIEFFKPVVLEGSSFEKGKYILYCIPHESNWELIFNSNLYSWGLQMDSSKNIKTLRIPVQYNLPELENFSIRFDKTDSGGQLWMAWDRLKVVANFTY